MAVFGGLVAGPALAILGAVSTDEMEEKLEKAKAYYSQVEKAVNRSPNAMRCSSRSLKTPSPR
ncbi:hypothetical protein BTM417_11900 [Helicobacter pylori]